VTVHRFSSMGCEVVVGGAHVAARREIERLFSARDETFSRFRGASELNRVNECAGRPTKVSAEFASMLTLALEAAQVTEGLVQPALGAALEAAGYDRDFALLSDDGLLRDVDGAGDWRALRLVGRHVVCPRGVQLDLNGVVKARTVDDALALSRGEGFVSAGGDIAVRGDAVVALPDGEAVQLVRGALATSGTDRRRWLAGGVVQHHLIDPRTGRPSRSRWTHVTACGADCVAADVAAKAAFLLDDDGPAWLDRRGIPGRFVDSHGAVRTNAAWRELVPEHAYT
jgi:FAD:protein FMN transferase